LARELGAEKVVLLVRSAQGKSELLGKLAAELVVDHVDVILAVASGSLEAARHASQSIPIVALDLESDPIATGAVQSLNRPGGNVTGIFFDAPEIAGKWVQIIKEMLPQVSKVALLYDLQSGPNAGQSRRKHDAQSRNCNAAAWHRSANRISRCVPARGWRKS
jgi:putative tryptophan/tyrosine transport system substrate-binding protein